MREFEQSTPGHDSAANGGAGSFQGGEQVPARPATVSPNRVGSEPRSAHRVVSPHRTESAHVSPVYTPSHIERASLTAPAVTLSRETVDPEWRVVTGTVQRRMATNPHLREQVKSFATVPVTEDLPATFADAVTQADSEVGAVAARYEENLGEYIAVPSVPDTLIVPDIHNAPSRESGLETMRIAKRDIGVGSRLYKIGIEARDRGISDAERKLVSTRYVYARDVKLLALGAELQDERSNAATNEAGEVVLPSGVRLFVDPARDDGETLLDPTTWEGRTQLKDRVHTFTADGKRYIMKERKTARHTDTLKHGHEDLLTSKEEFEAAKAFEGKVVTAPDNIQVRWEKPVGYAMFPDGYQFSVFEYEDLSRASTLHDDLEQAMIGAPSVEADLAQAIVDHPEQFGKEYEEVKAALPSYREDDRLASYTDRANQSIFRRRSVLETIRTKWSGDNTHRIQTLSYPEFATIKAHMMMWAVDEIVDTAITEAGYTDPDTDGHVVQLHHGETVGLDVIAFDFERYEPITEEQRAEQLARKLRLDEYKMKKGINFVSWGRGGRGSVTKTQQATYLELLRRHQEAA